MGTEPQTKAAFDWGKQLPRLAGERVVLRWLTDQDSEAVFEIFGDPEVMRYWSSPALKNLDAAADLIKEIHHFFDTRRLFQWGICLRESDEVIGTCTLLNLDLTHRRAEIGFALRRSVWGRGYASEAISLLLRFSFESLDLHRLEADVDPENERSIRLLERHGFQREGYLRERWHHLGEIRDTVFLGLLRDDWPGVEALGRQN